MVYISMGWVVLFERDTDFSVFVSLSISLYLALIFLSVYLTLYTFLNLTVCLTHSLYLCLSISSSHAFRQRPNSFINCTDVPNIGSEQGVKLASTLCS